jgi:hypothetical protein
MIDLGGDADWVTALQEMITHNDGRLLLCYT